MSATVKIFLSTVSDEFRPSRDQLRTDLTRHNVEVKVQEDFKDLGSDTLDKLDVYICSCDAVVHLIGEMTGSQPADVEQHALLRKHPDLPSRLPPLAEALKSRDAISYTQWEAWLALYHGKLLLTAKADGMAPRGPKFNPTEASRISEATHLARLETIRRFPGCVFSSPADLAKHIAFTAILDLLVKSYADEEGRRADVAEGFIREMASKVRAATLDLEGMKRAIRDAIDIYEKEIAGGQTQTNVDDIIDTALTKARAQVDKGKSALARATLRRAPEEMRREEEERREQYVEGVTVLYRKERDVALAAYDGEAAAASIVALAEAIHGADQKRVADAIIREADNLTESRRDRGNNVYLLASIALRRQLVAIADALGERRGEAYYDLGELLLELGRNTYEIGEHGRGSPNPNDAVYQQVLILYAMETGNGSAEENWKDYELAVQDINAARKHFFDAGVAFETALKAFSPHEAEVLKQPAEQALKTVRALLEKVEVQGSLVYETKGDVPLNFFSAES
jgi:Domain of unknown function (DUF4062)